MKRLQTTYVVIGAISIIVPLGSFIGVAILEVLHGHGADTFVDTGRFQVTWIYMLLLVP
jgi:hypothetical protein